MGYEKSDEPLELRKEFLEQLASVDRQEENGELEYVSHTSLMNEINAILSETRGAVGASKEVFYHPLMIK